MPHKLTAVDGIGPRHASQLAKQGITRTDHLLAKAATRKQRRLLSEASGVSEIRLYEFVNRADLMRVPRIGPVVAGLLERAGVPAVRDLAKQKPRELHTTLGRAISRSSVSVNLPGVHVVAEWICAAKELPTVVRK